MFKYKGSSLKDRQSVAISCEGCDCLVLCLTGIGDSEPGSWSHNVTAGIGPGLVSIVIGVGRQQVGQSENVANEPNQQNGKDDLRETWN